MTTSKTDGRYAIVDTTLAKTDATVIESLSGRQGDNGRIVYFAIKDGNLPHNLDGQDVQLSAKDAAGKVKVLTGIYDMISATAGLFSMLIPTEFYQAAGDVEEAFLSVIDNKNTVISTIPITFTVFPNGIIISANASKEYLSGVQELIDASNQKIADLQSGINVQQTAYETLQRSLDNITAMINNNQVPTLGGNNDYLSTNTFEKDVIAKGGFKGNLDGNAKTASTADVQHIDFKYHKEVDLNALPDSSELYTQKTMYFSTPTALKNAPANVTRGLVETFVQATGSILQRFTCVIDGNERVYHRFIYSWDANENSATYGKWFSERDVKSKSIKAFGGTVYFTRIGNSVTVSADIEKTNFKIKDFAVAYSSGTIPAGYRPAVDYAGIVMETPTWLKGSNRNPGAVQFGASGWIGARSAFVKDDLKSWITLAGTYVTNDSMPG